MQVQLFLAFIYIIIITVMIGSAFKRSTGIADVMLRGFIFQLVVFSLCYYITVFILHTMSLDILARLYLFSTSLVAIYGGCRVIWHRGQVKSMLMELSASISSNKVYAFASLVIISCQVVRAGIMEPISISDNCEYYQVITAMVEKGEVYASGFAAKYVTSSWYPYEAFLARFTGCHGTIIASTVLPVLLILLAYCALWRLGQVVFEGDNRKNCLFLFIAAIVTEGMLINADPAAYMLVWPTWGKNLPPTIVCPLLLALFIEQAKMPQIDVRATVWMFLLSVVAANATAASMLAVPLQMFALSIVFLFRKKRIDLCLMSVVVIIPEIIQFILYVMFSSGRLAL